MFGGARSRWYSRDLKPVLSGELTVYCRVPGTSAVRFSITWCTIIGSRHGAWRNKEMCRKGICPKRSLSLKGKGRKKSLMVEETAWTIVEQRGKAWCYWGTAEWCGWSRWCKGGGRRGVTREKARRLSKDQTLETIYWVRVQTLWVI